MEKFSRQSWSIFFCRAVVKLDGVAPLVTDPPHANSTTWQTSTHLRQPLYIVVTSEPIMKFKDLLDVECPTVR